MIILTEGILWSVYNQMDIYKAQDYYASFLCRQIASRWALGKWMMTKPAP